MTSSNTSSRLSLGLAMILLGSLLVYGRVKPVVLTDTFEGEPVEVQGFSQENFDETRLPKRIIIPRLNIDLNVKRSSIIGGYWEVFNDSAGWGEGSGISGQPGNQVIFAHARKGLFLPLRSIEVDDMIYVLTQYNWYSYKVSEIKEVFPLQTEVISPTEEEILTLYTCSGYGDSKRLIVTANRN